VGAVVSDDATAETDVTIVKDSALTWGNAKDRVVELDADTAVFHPFYHCRQRLRLVPNLHLRLYRLSGRVSIEPVHITSKKSLLA
jgi:hypothetical protein